MRISGVSWARVGVVLCLIAVNLWGQGSRQVSPYSEIEEKDRDNPRAREQWFARGRTVPGESSAQLRYRAFQQKMQLRQRRALQMSAVANSVSVTPWLPLGPAPLASDAGTGQDYNWVSGRATAVAIDPADGTGNTVFVGGAHGGVWKSTNAGPASPSPGSVTWRAVADYAETLAVGAIAIQPGNNNPANSIVLVGTGEPNSSIDSYYGLGILRSANGGTSWTLIRSSSDVPARSFAGLGFSKIAFSTANPQLVVAAAAGASQGIQEGLENPVTVNRGLYVSTDGGQTWRYASVKDGAIPTVPGSVTSVVYNSAAGMFFAALRYHGVYASSDGVNWTRLEDVNQPGGLSSARCPGDQSSSGCPFYRAELTVVPGRNEMYVWVVYLDSLGNEVDGGIWQSRSSGSAPWVQVHDAEISSCGDLQGCGVMQGTYNLELLALPNNTTTDLYAGAVNLYKCTIGNPESPFCTFLNLTHVYGTCASLEKVHPDQHHLAGVIASGKELLYFANDGGIYRALNGFTDLTSGSCGPNQFDSLIQTLGSMTQFVGFSIHPTDPATILGGTQDNGSPATSAATGSQWLNVHAGDGGYNAILPTSPTDWFASYPDTGGGRLEIDHCGSGINCTDPSFTPVVVSSGSSGGGPVGVGGDDGGFYFPYILDPQSPATMLIGTCRIWRVLNATNPTASTPLSDDFEPGSTVPCTGAEVNVVRSIAAGGPKDIAGLSRVIYAGTDGLGPLNSSNPSGGRVFVTTNAGSTVPTEVTRTVNPNHYPVAAIAMDTSDASGQTAYVGIMGFHVSHVFKTSNAGGSWTDFSGTSPNGLPDAPVNSLLVDATAGMIYSGTDVGVFASPTSGANWSEVGPAAAAGSDGFLPNVPVTALQLFNSGGQKLLRASTYGRGVWQYNLVSTPDYAIGVQNSPLTVFASVPGAFSGTLTAFAGYGSGVALSCAANPGAGGTNPPSTCTPPGNSVTPSTGGTPFQVNVSGASGDYRFNVHGVGSDPSQVTHDATVTLHIVDFVLQTPSPASVSVPQNSISSAVTVVVTASGSFNGTVSLSCTSGLPAYAECNFSSPSVQPTSSNPATVTLTISTGASTPQGSSTVIISATTPGAPAAKTQRLGVAVTPPTPDYVLTIANPTQSASVNQAATFQGTLTSVFGYGSPVNLSCGGSAPPGCTISPASVTPTTAGASFTATVQSSAVQTYAFTIQGVGTDAAHMAHSTGVTFTSQFSFTLAYASGPQTVKAGQTATYHLSVTPPGGATFPSMVTFACSGLPAGSSCSSPQIAAGASGVQNVSLAITTLGPNTDTQQRPTARNHGPAPFVVWMSVAGLVFGGLSRRTSQRSWTMLGLMVLMATALTFASCGGTGGGGSGSGGGGVTISVSPSSGTLFPTQQQQFTATVAGSSNTGVNWTASTGSIDGNGLYLAPASLTASTQATITAVALADVTKSAQARVTIQAPTPSGSYTITITATMGGTKPTTSATLTVE